MSLIKCPECGKEISDKSQVCIHCGYPIKIEIEKQRKELEKYRCNGCNKQNNIGSTYCAFCGNKLNAYNNIKSNYAEIAKTKENYIIKKKEVSGAGIVSIILGSIGLLFSFITVGIIFIIPGLLVGIIGFKNKRTEHSFCKIGVIICTLGLIISIFASFISCQSINSDESKIESTSNNTSLDKSIETKEDIKKDELIQQEVIEPSFFKEFQSENISFVDEMSQYSDVKVAETVYDVYINKIGFKEVKFERKMEGLENFYITADGFETVATAMPDYCRVFIPNSDYVFYDDGELILKADDFLSRQIDYLERGKYYFITKEIITKCLKVPNSADFPSEMEVAMEKKDNLISVQGYVESDNIMGVKIKSDYIVQFYITDIENILYEVQYINIDGESEGSFINIH